LSAKKANSLMVTLAEGLTGYMTFQTRTGLSPAFHRYLLFDPIVRIARDKLWKVRSSEVLGDGNEKTPHNSIDFIFESQTHEGLVVGLQLKWYDESGTQLHLGEDIEKLHLLRKRQEGKESFNFILIALHHTLNNPDADHQLPKIRNADLDQLQLCYSTDYPTRYSRYGAVVFEVKYTSQLHL